MAGNAPAQVVVAHQAIWWRTYDCTQHLHGHAWPWQQLPQQASNVSCSYTWRQGQLWTRLASYGIPVAPQCIESVSDNVSVRSLHWSSPQARSHFQHVFRYPTDAQILLLSPDQFPRFIYYLYERDKLYVPIYVDGPGDGGVDLELRAQNGASPSLQGVVQCKRYLRRKVRPKDLVDFIAAARRSEADRRYYFTTRGYTPAARRDARQNNIIPFDAPAIRDWIHDIERREKGAVHAVADLPHRDQVPIPIICVANHKGGVSKTTITGNLASALATAEQGVLVIDMDPQGHLSRWLTDQTSHFAADLSVHAVLSKQYPIHGLVRKTLEPGVWLLPSSRELVDLPAGYDAYTMERQLTHALAALPLADPPIGYILIDTPPSLNVLTRAAVIAANCLLVPLQLDSLSYDGLTDFLTFLESVEAAHDRKQPVHLLGGVATLVEARLSMSQKFAQEIPQVALNHSRMERASLTLGTFWMTSVRRRADFPRAIVERKSVLRLGRSSDAAKDIAQLAKEVSRRVPHTVRRSS